MPSKSQEFFINLSDVTSGLAASRQFASGYSKKSEQNWLSSASNYIPLSQSSVCSIGGTNDSNVNACGLEGSLSSTSSRILNNESHYSNSTIHSNDGYSVATVGTLSVPTPPVYPPTVDRSAQFQSTFDNSASKKVKVKGAIDLIKPYENIKLLSTSDKYEKMLKDVLAAQMQMQLSSFEFKLNAAKQIELNKINRDAIKFLARNTGINDRTDIAPLRVEMQLYGGEDAESPFPISERPYVDKAVDVVFNPENYNSYEVVLSYKKEKDASTKPKVVGNTGLVLGTVNPTTQQVTMPTEDNPLLTLLRTTYVAEEVDLTLKRKFSSDKLPMYLEMCNGELIEYYTDVPQALSALEVFAKEKVTDVELRKAILESDVAETAEKDSDGYIIVRPELLTQTELSAVYATVNSYFTTTFNNSSKTCVRVPLAYYLTSGIPPSTTSVSSATVYTSANLSNPLIDPPILSVSSVSKRINSFGVTAAATVASFTYGQNDDSFPELGKVSPGGNVFSTEPTAAEYSILNLYDSKPTILRE